MKCPECGIGFVQWSTEDILCPQCEIDGMPEDRAREIVFTNCNVCGRPLWLDDEDQMGMCVKCSQE